jgi:hypothetical protein
MKNDEWGNDDSETKFIALGWAWDILLFLCVSAPSAF